MMMTQNPPQVCRSGLLLQGLYPHMMCGYDRGGRPVRVECMGRVNTAEMYRHTTEEQILRYHIWQNEEIERRYLPAASRRTGHEHSSVTVVLDMTNGSLGDLMSSDARKHIHLFVQVLSDFFPETLNRMLIVNAPRLLSIAWDFVTPLLDAQTKRKITIAPPGVRTRSLLHTVIHPSQLPVFLGGELRTPLDKLLPIVDSGGGPDDFERISGHWEDGYWGLATADSGHIASSMEADHAAHYDGDVVIDRSKAAAISRGVNPIVGRPLVSSKEQPLGQLEANDPALLEGNTVAVLDVVGKVRAAEHAERYDAATFIALAFRRKRINRQRVHVAQKKQGRERLNTLFYEVDALMTNANWLRAEKTLFGSMEDGDFQRWYAEDEDYAEVQEILGACAIAKGAYEQAADCYMAGLAHRPDGPRLRLGLARALVRLGNIEAAKPHLDYAIALRPSHGPTLKFMEEVESLQDTVVRKVLTPAQTATAERIQKTLAAIQEKEESTPRPGGFGIEKEERGTRNGDAAAQGSALSMAMAVQASNELDVNLRADAYFANIESLRLLALQILQGSKDRPGYRAADDVGDDWQINGGGTAGAGIGAHVNVARDDLSAALGRMKTGAQVKVAQQALDALYGDWGAQRSGRLGVANPDTKYQVEWADVEVLRIEALKWTLFQ